VCDATRVEATALVVAVGNAALAVPPPDDVVDDSIVQIPSFGVCLRRKGLVIWLVEIFALAILHFDRNDTTRDYAIRTVDE
jgi:hypothetical protein